MAEERKHTAEIVQLDTGTGTLASAVYERLRGDIMSGALMPGEKLQVAHKSPFGGTPVAVNVLGALIGLSRQEADLILVERSTP